MKANAGAIMTFAGALCLAAERFVSRIPQPHYDPNEGMHAIPIGVAGLTLVTVGIVLAFRDEAKKSST